MRGSGWNLEVIPRDKARERQYTYRAIQSAGREGEQFSRIVAPRMPAKGGSLSKRKRKKRKQNTA